MLPKTIADHIFDNLRRAIITGIYRPGQVLREEEIRERHQSSRGPIRESLRLLLQTGLVEHRPRRGFRVRSYTENDVRQIYRMRALLEGRVFQELEPDDLTPVNGRIDRELRQMAERWDRGDLIEYFDHKSAFLRLLTEASDNRILGDTVAFVNEVSLPVRHQSFAGARKRDFSPVSFYAEIMEHARAGNGVEAGRMMEARILGWTDNALRAHAELMES